MPPSGLEAIFLANRDKLIRFLAARGAGEAAEDLVHDLWLKVSRRSDGPIANPLSYLYRAADTLMIDRYRARRQAQAREQAWEDGAAERVDVAADRVVAARQETARVAAVLAGLGPRVEAVFRRARLDGESQRQIAADLGVSISTVEADLRAAARALLALQEQIR
ncbi:MAG: RNA polymerase sigma factor [Comamonadaceae bacterium]|nr:MAG: RNA polymerase sigma factor [Comamonadaceae bacterium]